MMRQGVNHQACRAGPHISAPSSLTEAPCKTLCKAYRETPKLAPWTAIIAALLFSPSWEGTGGRFPEAQPSFTMSRMVFFLSGEPLRGKGIERAGRYSG